MKKISGNNYSLEVPDTWEAENSGEGQLSIFDPNGNGAVTISSYTSLSDSPIVETALEKFVKGKGEIKTRRRGDLDIAESEYEELSGEEKIFTQAAALSKNNQLLLVSYNCKKEVLNPAEVEAFKKIVDTIRIY